MDDRVDQHERDLDGAIEASRLDDPAADAGELGDTVERLHKFALSGPQLEEVRMRRSIEDRIDEVPQGHPWWRPGWTRPHSMGRFGRKLAIGGAIASIALGVGVGSLLTSAGSASAAFMENVQALSDLTDDATADGVIDEDEAEAIAELIETLHEEADEGSLDDLDADELAAAATLLASIDETLDAHDGEDDGLDEVSDAVVAAIGSGDDGGDGDGNGDGDGDGDALVLDADSFTADEMAAAMDALAILEADVDALKVDASTSLDEALASFDGWAAAITAAQTEALGLIGAVPDYSGLGPMTEDELEAYEEELDALADSHDDLLDEQFDTLDED